MPPAIVAAAAAVATAVVQTFVTNAIIAAILTIAINVAAVLLLRRPQGRTNQGQEIKLKLDPTMPRQICLGRAATGGSVVWAFTFGSSEKSPGGLYLVRIIALSDLPCTGVVAVMEGKKVLQFDGDILTGHRLCTNEHITDGGGRRMRLRVYLGSPPAVADPDLISWSGGLWTTAHKGTNMCYAIVRYRYDTEGDAFPSGEPQITFVLDGVKCYDDRKDSTKPGGLGLHRLNDPNTWEYTRNTAIHAAQSLRGFYSNGVLLFGAEAEERDLNTDMLFSAYNTCDQNVVYSGGVQKRYESGIMVNSHDSLAAYLQEFQAAFDGRIIDRGGSITLLPGATRTPVFNLTDDDIVWNMEKSWQPKATLSELYNYVAGVFVDEETVFAEKGYPPLRNAAWEDDDGGERLNLQVSFTAVTNWARVQRITKRIHQQSRFQGTIAFYLPLWGIEMEQGDWFTFTSTRWGFSMKYFEAMTVDLIDTQHVMVIGRETSPTIDGWAHAVDEKPRGDTTWNPPDVALPVPTITPAALHSTNNAEQSEEFGVAITIGGIEDVDNIIAPTTVHLQISPADDNLPVEDLAAVQAVHQTVSFYGLLPATAYSVRARSTDGVAVSPWSEWADFSTEFPDYALDVVVPPTLTIPADYLGELKEPPYYIDPIVSRGTLDLRFDDFTDYSVEFTNVVGSVNNTNDDPDKGRVTITDVTSASGNVKLITSRAAVVVVRDIPIIRLDDPPPIGGGTGGGSGGGSGNSVSWASGFLTLGSSSHSLWASPLKTITIGAGEDLHGVANLTYQVSGVAAGVDRGAAGKWQHSPTGAGTWTDFGAEVFGSDSTQGGNAGTAVEPEIYESSTGSILVDQTAVSPGAGTYDVRLVGRVAGTGSLGVRFGSASVTAE
jgi:hypothetical protein